MQIYKHVIKWANNFDYYGQTAAVVTFIPAIAISNVHDPPEFNSEMDIYWFADPFCQTEGVLGGWQFHLQNRDQSLHKIPISLIFTLVKMLSDICPWNIFKWLWYKYKYYMLYIHITYNKNLIFKMIII